MKGTRSPRNGHELESKQTKQKLGYSILATKGRKQNGFVAKFRYPIVPYPSDPIMYFEFIIVFVICSVSSSKCRRTIPIQLSNDSFSLHLYLSLCLCISVFITFLWYDSSNLSFLNSVFDWQRLHEFSLPPLSLSHSFCCRFYSGFFLFIGSLSSNVFEFYDGFRFFDSFSLKMFIHSVQRQWPKLGTTVIKSPLRSS